MCHQNNFVLQNLKPNLTYVLGSNMDPTLARTCLLTPVDFLPGHQAGNAPYETPCQAAYTSNNQVSQFYQLPFTGGCGHLYATWPINSTWER